MNITGIQPFSDLGIKFETSSHFLGSQAAMIPLTSLAAPVGSQSQTVARTGAISAGTPLTNGTPSTSLNGTTNNPNLIAATTSAMLQSLPQSSSLDKKTRERVNYLQQLLKDKKQCQLYPTIFVHVERLLDEGKCGSK